MKKEHELTNPDSCMSKALPHEETFVILARDPAALVAIQAWIEARIAIGKNERTDEQIGNAQASCWRMSRQRESIRKELDGVEAFSRLRGQ